MALYKRRYSSMEVSVDRPATKPTDPPVVTVENGHSVTIKVGYVTLVVTLSKDGALEARFVPGRGKTPKSVVQETTASGAALRILL